MIKNEQFRKDYDKVKKGKRDNVDVDEKGIVKKL